MQQEVVFEKEYIMRCSSAEWIECLEMMPSWCGQLNWGNCGIPWVNCAVLCVKDDWKGQFWGLRYCLSKLRSLLSFFRQVWRHTVRSLSLTESVTDLTWRSYSTQRHVTCTKLCPNWYHAPDTDQSTQRAQIVPCAELGNPRFHRTAAVHTLRRMHVR